MKIRRFDWLRLPARRNPETGARRGLVSAFGPVVALVLSVFGLAGTALLGTALLGTALPGTGLTGTALAQQGGAPAGMPGAAAPFGSDAAAAVGSVASSYAAAEASTGAGQPVRLVRIVGNQRVEESAIATNVTVAQGEALDPEKVDRDLKAIHAMGFFSEIFATVQDYAGGVILNYHVVEQPYLREVRVTGVESLDIEEVEGTIGVRARTIYDPRKAWKAVREATDHYGREGYPDARITFELSDVRGGEASLDFRVEEGPLVNVYDIRFEGNEAFSDRKLRSIMATRERWMFSWMTGAGLLNEEELATDVERLMAFFYDNGYVRAVVDEPTVVRSEDGLQITVRVNEGDRYVVGDVGFAGDVHVEKDRLREVAGIEPGSVFKPSLLRGAVFALTEEYGNLGYAFADISPGTEVVAEEQKVDLEFRIDSGDIVHVRRIDVRGNSKTRDSVVRREMRLQEGERFSGTGLKTSRARIRRTGHFENVEITSNPTGESGEVDLVVDVQEGRTGTFAAGAGFSSADDLLLNARVTERNLFGRGQQLDLNLDVGSRRRNLRLGFTEPWFGGIPLLLGVELFDWDFRFSNFTRGGRGISLRTAYPLFELGYQDVFGMSLDNINAGVEYRLEDASIEGLRRFAPPSIQQEEGSRLTSSIRPSLVRNTIDHPFDPTMGSRQSLSAEFAGLGGSTDFIKVEARARWFFPMYTTEGGRTFVYSFGGTLGYGIGDSGESGEELPAFERYFPGGISTVRGFDVRTLGPRQEVPLSPPTGATDDFSSVDEEIGGSQQVIFNNEIILPLFPDAGLKGVVFFDAGNAFLASKGIDLSDLRYAVGWGIRWLSPFGPIRIEVGYPLDRRTDDQSSVVLFSFGAPL